MFNDSDTRASALDAVKQMIMEHVAKHMAGLKPGDSVSIATDSKDPMDGDGDGSKDLDDLLSGKSDSDDAAAGDDAADKGDDAAPANDGTGKGEGEDKASILRNLAMKRLNQILKPTDEG